MKELVFVNCWPDRKQAWSGTPEGLYSALARKIPVRQVDVYSGSRGKFGNILDMLTMQLGSIRKIENRIDADQSLNPGTPILVFGEYFTKMTKSMYCYQDLSVDYLLRLRQEKHPDANVYLKRMIPTAILKKKKMMADRFYDQCAGVFTMSQWLKQDLVTYTGVPAEKVHHAGGGCSMDITQCDYRNKQGNRFLFVGKDWEKKNGDLVAMAFEILRSRHADKAPEIYIAGPVQMPDVLNSMEGVRFLGRVSREELIKYYNLCDYFVMPSRCDAYGLVFLEALCFGLPCIGKNVCAMPEFIQSGKNGYLIEKDDPEELAVVMEKLLLNGREMASAVQADKEKYIQTYSWDTVADRILTVMKQDGYFTEE